MPKLLSKNSLRLAMAMGAVAVACAALLAHRSASPVSRRHAPAPTAAPAAPAATVAGAPVQTAPVPEDEAAASRPQPGVAECPGLRLPAVTDWATYRAASGDFSFRYPREFKVYEDIYLAPGAGYPFVEGELVHAVALDGYQPMDTNGNVLNIVLSMQVSVFRGEVKVTDPAFRLVLNDEGDVAAGHYKAYNLSQMERDQTRDLPYREINLFTPSGWTISVFDSFGSSCKEGSAMDEVIKNMMMGIASSFQTN